MAYWKTILKGSLGGVEVWSTSNSWGIFGLAPDVPDQALTDGMAAALRTFLTAANVPSSLKILLGTTGQLDALRVEYRAEDETTMNVSEALLNTPVVGAGTTNKTPQDAVVISLRTSTPGARGRGRMYWPALSATLNTSFQLTTPTPTTINGDAKTLLAGIGTAMNGVYIAAASAKRVVLAVRSGTDHASRDVTSLQVGSILDTQRRRRDNLPESYVSVTYP